MSSRRQWIRDIVVTVVVAGSITLGLEAINAEPALTVLGLMLICVIIGFLVPPFSESDLASARRRQSSRLP